MAKININLDSLKPKREWKRHKIAEGHNIFRILPPFGENSNGYPYRKWMITWGLLDPESNRQRPFASSLTSEKACPIVEYVDALTKKAEAMKAQMKAAGSSDADIKERLKDLNNIISQLRPKTVFAYNAINKAGEVGILEVKTTAHKKLKDHMMQYIKDYNQDPTSLNSADDDSGVWFDFVRSGQGFDTEYDVKKVQTKVKGPTGATMFVDDRSPLQDNVVESYADMAYDLSSIYQVKKYEELKQILLANIANIVAMCPDAQLDGFGATTAPTTQTTTATKLSKPAVTLNLDSDDDDLAEAPAATVTKLTKPTVATTMTIQDDDDIFKMADSILNG